MEATLLALILVKLFTLALAATFLLGVGKAYLSGHDRSILLLFVAVALFAAGVIVEGALVQFTQISRAVAHLVEGTTTLLAFLVLVMSVRIKVTKRHSISHAA